ncbi:hypothetical protein IMG5_201970 [Ichthyophthirius multifiliis]|uniref:Uncharacterized protein n=1 Tax=Ichthyophthirius multifiliis TaxID=5932 RepID=G0R614_ICHMU|nr:hypothetical protein IMG5_201970 [Ichthyophthirius multifiliis]EGR27080.1 hypothetical protein IMG5_201970 [Ichthyophthirius multifiliis]|eukprot:XP_004023964.1 hypothetical protein IMG5_201970 [Ichthyophthirius multifiliis]
MSSFKDQILYEILVLSCDLQDYNQQLFIEFLQNPPQIKYPCTNQQQKLYDNRKYDYRSFQDIHCLNISKWPSQIKLITEYLRFYFKNAKNAKDYEKYIAESTLNEIFYTVKIQNGETDYIQKAKDLLGEDRIQNLINERSIFIRNKNYYFSQNEKVELFVETKNIQNLNVKLFEIRTENYYIKKKAAFDNLISLDGLIPLDQQQYNYKDQPHLKILRTFNFEKLQQAKRGIFIVEFIGNSISSRAVINKGFLSYLENNTIAGKKLTLIDENQNICKPQQNKRTGLWYGDRFHEANENGQVMIPYKSQAQSCQLILVHEDYAELIQNFYIQSEEYAFKCTYMYNQEQFLQGNKAIISIQPVLEINNVVCNPEIIEEQIVKVHVLNYQNIPNTFEFKDIKFDHKKQLEISFPVQSILKSVKIECEGIITKMDQKKQKVQNSKEITFELHQDPENQLFNSYLKNTEKQGYIVQILGKSGQGIPQLPIEVSLQHQRINNQDFKQILQTDDNGNIVLGLLDNIQSLQIKSLCFSDQDNIQLEMKWNLCTNGIRLEFPQTIIVIEGETIQLPVSNIQLNKQNFCFYSGELNTYPEIVYQDMYDCLNVKNNFLEINQLKEGNYILKILEYSQTILIQVIKGKYWDKNSNFIISEGSFQQVFIHIFVFIYQYIFYTDLKIFRLLYIMISLNIPKQLKQYQKEQLKVQVLAYNFMPHKPQDYVNNLRQRSFKNLNHTYLKQQKSVFFNNKQIGDEICYVINRQNEKKLIGNTLEKPCILLKKTFNQETVFEKEELNQGEDYQCNPPLFSAQSGGMQCMRQQCCQKNFNGMNQYQIENCCAIKKQIQYGEIDNFFNFLSVPSFFATNLEINEDGSVILSDFQWKNYSTIQVIVSNLNVAISDIFPIQQELTPFQDLKHQQQSKKDKFYVETFNAKNLNKGEQLIISADSQSVIVSTLGELFELQKQLSKATRNTDSYNGREYGFWSFVKDWHQLNSNQKLQKYNEFSCHELNLFLYFKDNEFFQKVVQPFLINKMQKTFLDYFLLNDLNEIFKYSSPEKTQELNILEQCLLLLSLVQNNHIQSAQILLISLKNKFQSKSLTQKNTELQKKLYLTIIQCQQQNQNLEQDYQKVQLFSSQQNCFAIANEKMINYSQKTQNKQMEPLKASDMMSMNMGIQQKMQMKSDMHMEQEEQEGQCLSDSNDYEDYDDYDDGDGDGDEYYQSKLIQQRKQYKVGYQKLEKTIEYIERHYYDDKNIDQYKNLVQINQFWVDFASYIFQKKSVQNFVSESFIYAVQNHVELLAVVSLVDFSHKDSNIYNLNIQPGRKIQIQANNNIVVFQKQITESAEINKGSVNIIQRFFDPQDRFGIMKEDPSVKVEKDVDEYIINKVYGCQLIISNISITALNLSVLYEIPEGALPINAFEYIKTQDVQLESYQTKKLEFFFYFPEVGVFGIYPSNASRNGVILAQANVINNFDVKKKRSVQKMENLSDILNNGSKKDILSFAQKSNLYNKEEFNISKIMHIIKQDKNFFLEIINILKSQQLFIEQVWNLSFHHQYLEGVIELFKNQQFIKSLKQPFNTIYYLNSTQIKIDQFNQFEYHPLLNSRVHNFMNQSKSKIQNKQFKSTYDNFLKYLAHIPVLNEVHYLTLCYYLILQERVEEAISVFNRIDFNKIQTNQTARIQYDYFNAYLDIYTGFPDFKKAREISQQYVNYPIISWKNLFQEINKQLIEYDGGQMEIEQEEAEQGQLGRNLNNSDKDQDINIQIQNKQILIEYQNAEQAELNFYEIDLEILFSTQPFIQENRSREEFTFIKPTFSQRVQFEKTNNREALTIPIPDHLVKKHLHVQLITSNKVIDTSYFSSSLKVNLIEKYGQVKVLDENNKPLSKVYVKCFAKQKNGEEIFYRDGYTDLRGRFDYALSSANEIEQVNLFAVLICSEEHGAIIKTAKPPVTGGRMEKTL